jgi:branched-chain amino acid transport system ATP-binding protein
LAHPGKSPDHNTDRPAAEAIGGPRRDPVRLMLEVSGLEAGYGDGRVLFGVDLAVGAGEVVTLLGRNGMGKTTTLSAVMGILRAQGGAVRLDGAAIHALPAYRIARLGLALVPEGRQVFPNLTVRENLVATAKRRPGLAAPWTLAAVLELFPGLRERQDQFGALLSGGEQQMLAIGRALMTNPRLLLLDEAAEGLAPRMRAEIWQVLARLKAAGLAILVVDKNIAPLLRLADRHYILEKGRTVWCGGSTALAAAIGVQHRYLGV